jgi:hypothetical protein
MLLQLPKVMLLQTITVMVDEYVAPKAMLLPMMMQTSTVTVDACIVQKVML